MDSPSCPECGSYAVKPIIMAQHDNLAEYRCRDCGHYFVDVWFDPTPVGEGGSDDDTTDD